MPLTHFLRRIEVRFKLDFTESDRARILETVDEWRSKWRYDDESRREWHARQGRKSGEARRQRTADRDRSIMADLESGMLQKDVAQRYGLSRSGIYRICKRMEREVASTNITTSKPSKRVEESREEVERWHSSSGNLKGQRVHFRPEPRKRPIEAQWDLEAEFGDAFERRPRPRADSNAELMELLDNRRA